MASTFSQIEMCTPFPEDFICQATPLSQPHLLAGNQLEIPKRSPPPSSLHLALTKVDRLRNVDLIEESSLLDPFLPLPPSGKQ